MKLYFYNSRGERRLIGEPTTQEGANMLIHSFLKAHNYRSYYTRMWEENGELWYDVGSHSEFFILNKTSNEV